MLTPDWSTQNRWLAPLSQIRGKVEWAESHLDRWKGSVMSSCVPLKLCLEPRAKRAGCWLADTDTMFRSLVSKVCRNTPAESAHLLGHLSPGQSPGVSPGQSPGVFWPGHL